MKEVLNVKITQDDLRMDANVVYMQAPAFGGLATKPLMMSVIYHKTSDIAFNENNNGMAGVCDLWNRSPIEKPFPCIIWVCGGGWTITDRFCYLPDLFSLAHRGFVLVSIDYMGNNEARFPSQICEIKSAIRYLRANAEKYHIDPNRIAIMGESAGGYYTNMIAATGETKEFDCGENLEYSSAVQAACCLYGPAECSIDEKCGIKYMHYLQMSGAYNGMPDELRVRANPINYISKNTPPMLIVHGEEDACVPLWRGYEWYDALEKAGVIVDMLQIKHAGHADIRIFQPEVINRIADFFLAHF